VKTEEQQGVMVLHRSRDLLMRQRTMILNAIRAHLAEFGTIAAQGPSKVAGLVTGLQGNEALMVPAIARGALLALAAQLGALATAIRGIERQLLIWHRQNRASQRLETIPGVGIITATALAASVPDPTAFKSGRQFAAFLGLVPRQNSSGGKDHLGHISKMGNGYLRRLLGVGATSVTRRAETTDTPTGARVRSLLGRKPTRLVNVAIANKTARTVWAMLVRQEDYRASTMA
jgi:transposase